MNLAGLRCEAPIQFSSDSSSKSTITLPLERIAMVAPIVGPYALATVQILTPSGSDQTLLIQRTGSRQRRPYNLPLVASLSSWKSLPGPVDTRWNEPIGISTWMDRSMETTFSSLRNDAYNDAYKRLVDQLGTRSEMGVNLAQRKQAVDMLTARVYTLVSFTRHLRRFEFNRAAAVLGIERKRVKNLNLRKEAKAFGNNWLEYHFGWSPLIHDIGAAIDLLQSPITPTRLKASGTSRVTQSSISYPPWSTQFFDRVVNVKVRLGCDVTVANPNLWLANQMGLVNPATVIWDSVPFSFVVDWFVNVSDFLGSFTTFAGLNIENSYNTIFWRSQLKSRLVCNNPYYVKTYGGTQIIFRRGLGLGTGPILKVRKPWQLSVTRGATAVSLLLQKLR